MKNMSIILMLCLLDIMVDGFRLAAFDIYSSSIAIKKFKSVNRFSLFVGKRAKKVPTPINVDNIMDRPDDPMAGVYGSIDYESQDYVASKVISPNLPMKLTEENVLIALDEVRPNLVADGGDVKFISIVGTTVNLELTGACSTCSSAPTTLSMGIEAHLRRRIPEVTSVGQIEQPVTAAAVEAILQIIRQQIAGAEGEISIKEINGLEASWNKEPVTDVPLKVYGGAVPIAPQFRPTITLNLRGSQLVQSFQPDIIDILKASFPTATIKFVSSQLWQ